MKNIYSKDDEPILSGEEQSIIVGWLKKNYLRLRNNGENRFMRNMDELPDIPQVVWEIKKRIIEKENLYGYKQEPLFKDSIGYMLDGGKLHEHSDPNHDNLIHTRFNVYVQIPESGGFPIYNGQTCKLKERTYICCRAGIDLHSCEKVVGNRERVILSYGFLIPQEQIENIIYDY